MNFNPRIVSRLTKFSFTSGRRGRGYTVPHVATNAERLAIYRSHSTPEIGNTYPWQFSPSPAPSAAIPTVVVGRAL